jgi:hypothetical protein
MDEDIEIPRLKKIVATIPEKLYIELANRNIINSNFDSWVAEAILDKMRKDEHD